MKIITKMPEWMERMFEVAQRAFDKWPIKWKERAWEDLKPTSVTEISKPQAPGGAR